MSGVLEQAERVGRWLENLLIGLLLVSMILLACTQIFLRNFDFGTLVWADQAINHAVLWVAMAAGVAAAREDRHISIDVLSRFLPPRGRAGVTLVVDLFTVSVCLALAWYSWQLTQFALEDQETLLIGIPVWVAQASLPLAFLLMAWRYTVWFARRLRILIRGEGG
ncbi:MAG: TRAP transporter small permease [Gammaproteobacteria bacterium]|nr:TRAP transporter small permease [Gammaproteobacteria bacterium]